MRGFPQELLFVLVGVVLLVQFLYERWRRRVAQARAMEGPFSSDPAAPRPLPRARVAAEPIEAPWAIEELQAAPLPPLVAPPLPRTRPRPRRFSRRALLRDRRAVQDAIVVATILQPCHAHRPHDIE